MRRRVSWRRFGASLAAPAWADESRALVRSTGAMEQGSLALGYAAARRSLVSVDGGKLRMSPRRRLCLRLCLRPDQAQHGDGALPGRTAATSRSPSRPRPRQYEIQRVNGLPQETVTPPPEVLARIKKEAENIYLARQRDTRGRRDFLSGFDWPAPGIESGVFGSQRIDNGVPMAPHFGVDMAAPTGTPIHAPADGVVTISRRLLSGWRLHPDRSRPGRFHLLSASDASGW